MSGGGTTTTQSVPDELKPLASAYAGKAMEIGNNPYQAFQGQRFAGLNGNQNSAIDMIKQRATNGSPVMTQGNSTLLDLLKGGQTNPYLDSMVQGAQKNLVTNYNNVIRPQVDQMAARSGSFGNSGVAATGAQAQDTLLQNLGQISTNMYGSAYDADRQRQLAALGMAPQYGNQAYMDAGQLLNAGTVQQGNQQQGLDFNYQQFLDKQNQPYKNLAAMGAPFGQNMGGQTTQSQQANPWSTGAGLLMLGNTLGMFSDRRLKSNIVRIGTHRTGIGIYEYDIFGKRERGVIAQELQEVMPDAVSTHASGYLMVDYSKV